MSRKSERIEKLVEEQYERRSRKQQEAKENRERKELKRKIKVEEAQRAAGVHARQAPPQPSAKVPPRWPPPPPPPPPYGGANAPLTPTLHRLRLLDRLGLVAGDDNPAAIRSAHRRLVLLWHPDKNPDPKAGEVFKVIQAAYEELIGK
jgi:hypothetical protein